MSGTGLGDGVDSGDDALEVVLAQGRVDRQGEHFLAAVSKGRSWSG
jgi:hypothetical protein